MHACTRKNRTSGICEVNKIQDTLLSYLLFFLVLASLSAVVYVCVYLFRSNTRLRDSGLLITNDVTDNTI